MRLQMLLRESFSMMRYTIFSFQAPRKLLPVILILLSHLSINLEDLKIPFLPHCEIFALSTIWLTFGEKHMVAQLFVPGLIRLKLSVPV